MQTFKLEQQSWTDVASYLESDNRIILPVGSTEQHGAFAPLGTDTYVAKAIAEDAGKKTGVLVAPPLWFGWSPHHLVGWVTGSKKIVGVIAAAGKVENRTCYEDVIIPVEFISHYE